MENKYRESLIVSIDSQYCLGIGASSKVNNENAAKELTKTLLNYGFEFSYIATIDKFINSIWLSYLKTQFEANILVFSLEDLAPYQSKLLSPSQQLFQSIGYYGVAEAAALAAFNGDSQFIIPKTISSGFTFAISKKK